MSVSGSLAQLVTIDPLTLKVTVPPPSKPADDEPTVAVKVTGWPEREGLLAEVIVTVDGTATDWTNEPEESW